MQSACHISPALRGLETAAWSALPSLQHLGPSAGTSLLDAGAGDSSQCRAAFCWHTGPSHADILSLDVILQGFCYLCSAPS